MMRTTGDMLRKKDIPSAIRQLHTWVAQKRQAIDALPDPDMTAYINRTIDEIERRINEQDYRWAIQSMVRHLVSTLRRMQEGEIVGITGTDGFHLAPIQEQPCD